MEFRFGDFLFDAEAHELRRGASTVPLSPKALRLLDVLIEACPRALSRQELQDRLWPDTHVTHTSLPRVVNELRQALDDDPKEPRHVRTVHGYGYAFRTPEPDPGPAGRTVEPTAGQPSPGPLVPFNLLWGGRQIPLPEGETVIGRDPECAVRIDSPKVSRRHARIRVRGATATLEDLGSKNGTKIGSKPVSGEVALSDGDEILIGPADLFFWATGSGSTETAAKG